MAGKISAADVSAVPSWSWLAAGVVHTAGSGGSGVFVKLPYFAVAHCNRSD